MFSFFRKKQTVPVQPPFDFAKNQFPAHTRWPPVFDQMTTREQFRLERKFRRRSKLKWARPVWNRNLQLIQWGSTIFLIGYCTFAVDWTGNQTKLDDKDAEPEYLKNIRGWFGDAVGSIWSHSSSQESREHVVFLQDRYKHEESSKKSST